MVKMVHATYLFVALNNTRHVEVINAFCYAKTHFCKNKKHNVSGIEYVIKINTGRTFWKQKHFSAQIFCVEIVST